MEFAQYLEFFLSLCVEPMGEWAPGLNLGKSYGQLKELPVGNTWISIKEVNKQGKYVGFNKEVSCTTNTIVSIQGEKR